MPTLKAIARRQARSYTYSFSMGIGDAWRVILPCYSYGQGGTSPYHEDFWQGGSHYNYGIGEPNYPVPALVNARTSVALDWYRNEDGFWTDADRRETWLWLMSHVFRTE